MPVLPPQDREVVFVQFTVIEMFVSAIDGTVSVAKMFRRELCIGTHAMQDKCSSPVLRPIHTGPVPGPAMMKGATASWDLDVDHLRGSVFPLRSGCHNLFVIG